MFIFRGVESHPRSFVKAVTWRMLGSLDTFILGLIFTGGNAKTAGAIAGTEVFTKIFLFYFHERIWSLVRWGHRPLSDQEWSAASAAQGQNVEAAPADTVPRSL